MDYSVKRFEYYEKRYTNVRIIIVITPLGVRSRFLQEMILVIFYPEAQIWGKTV